MNWRGSKAQLAKHILKHFPEHTIYIEPFFGSGGLFFEKPLARYNLLNDINSDIANFYDVAINQPEVFEAWLEIFPSDDTLLLNQKPTCPAEKAVQFFLRTNNTFLANLTTKTLQLGASNIKNVARDKLKMLQLLGHNNIRISNKSYKQFLNSIEKRVRSRAFIYADPPYLHTSGYGVPWKEEDLRELIAMLKEFGCKFALSEFPHETVLKIAKENNLHVTEILERYNVGKPTMEILITNYETNQEEDGEIK